MLKLKEHMEFEYGIGLFFLGVTFTVGGFFIAYKVAIKYSNKDEEDNNAS